LNIKDGMGGGGGRKWHR